MRVPSVLLLLAVPLIASAACTDPEPPFAGTWSMARTQVFSTSDCSAAQGSIAPIWTIFGDPDAGYRVGTGVTEGIEVVYQDVEDPGAAVLVPQLSLVLPESWPGFGNAPDAAPGIRYRLRPSGNDLVGTASASFPLLSGGTQEPCVYNWTVSATPLVGL